MERNLGNVSVMEKFNVGVQQEVVSVEAVAPRRLKPWVRKALVSMVVVPALVGTLSMHHFSKPVLEENVQWVKVEVPAGKGYDAAIHAAYAQLGEYDISVVDIRDLRGLAVERNGSKSLYKGSVIEVPVYTGEGQYR